MPDSIVNYCSSAQLCVVTQMRCNTSATHCIQASSTPDSAVIVVQFDPWKTNAREEAYYLLGLDVPWKDDKPWRSTESGQFLIDRHAHAWTALLI